MFTVNFQVRDNEIDIQGVVNHANYSIYFAHARHQFLHSIGIDFAEMAKEKLNLFLIESTIYFKKPLKPNQLFYVTCEMAPLGRIKFCFKQEIRLVDQDQLCASAENIGVCIDENRQNKPIIPEALKNYFSAPGNLF